MQQAPLIAAALALAGALQLAAPRADAAVGDAPSAADRGTPAASGGAGARRPGHVVGDMIDRHVVVSAPPGSALDPASLPRPGSQNIWLTLIRAGVRNRGGTPIRYEIDLRYQLINAPTQSRSLGLPAFQVRFVPASPPPPGSSRPAASATADIQEQRVTIAPILPASVPMSAAWVRPDRPAPALSGTPERLAAAVSTGLAIAIIAALISQLVLRRHNGPFAQAHRRLRRTVLRAERRGTAAAGAYPSALRIVHRAFDQTAGWRMFPDRVGEFVTHRRQFADLRGGIERFLAMSQREFFECRPQQDSPRERDDLRWLLAFTHDCRARERQAP